MNSDTEQESAQRAEDNLAGVPDETPTDPTPDAPTTAGGGNRRLLAIVAIITAVVLLCALVFAALWILASNSDNRAQAQLREKVLNAAEQGAVNFTTLDYQHVQQSLDNWTNSSTGNLSQQFTSGQTVSAFEQLIKQNKVVTSGTLQDATITDLQSNKASALVYLLVKRSVGGKAQPDEYLPLACSLTLTDKGWKISDISEPNNPYTGATSSNSPAPSSSGSAPTSGSSPTSTSKSGQ